MSRAEIKVALAKMEDVVPSEKSLGSSLSALKSKLKYHRNVPSPEERYLQTFLKNNIRFEESPNGHHLVGSEFFEY